MQALKKRIISDKKQSDSALRLAEKEIGMKIPLLFYTRPKIVQLLILEFMEYINLPENSIDKIAFNVATEQLGTSFNILKASAYTVWLKDVKIFGEFNLELPDNFLKVCYENQLRLYETFKLMPEDQLDGLRDMNKKDIDLQKIVKFVN